MSTLDFFDHVFFFLSVSFLLHIMHVVEVVGRKSMPASSRKNASKGEL